VKVLYWRRLDTAGLERLTIKSTADGIEAHGTIVTAADGGVVIEHRWHLDPDWRARSVWLRRLGYGEGDMLQLDRTVAGWAVNGAPRPDLDGAEEPDLSLTPFCNSFVIRRLPSAIGATIALDTAYIDAGNLTVERSRQRYERIDAEHVRYVDLGVAAGFEAVLRIDAEGLVDHYEHLFERQRPS
jgi:hypothetical protein